MQDTLSRRSTIITGVFSILALGLAIYAWKNIPRSIDVWPSVICIALTASLAELLAVSVGGERSLQVSPTSPIIWTAACVMDPFYAILTCVMSGVLTDLVALVSFSTLLRWRARAELGLCSSPDELANDPRSELRAHLIRALLDVAELWGPRASCGWFKNIRASVLYVANLTLVVGIAGAAYYYLGGRFLVNVGLHFSVFSQFVLPFFGLVAASVITEHTFHIVSVATYDPVPGARGIYGVLLRVHLAFIEDCLPILRGQFFLVFVAILMSYLYAHINVLGLLVTIMPVIALRDFYSQWVEVRAAYFDTIATLAAYMQRYHPYTRGHLKRVADMSVRLAREMRLPAESIRQMSTAGLLHDIGKVGVSEDILDKPGALDDDEWAKIKEHPMKGAEIIKHLEFLEGIGDWIKYHHKWYNGSGYPATNGDVIPVEAAVIAVTDSFDAMTDDRDFAGDWECDTCGYRPGSGLRPETCPECGAVKVRLYRQPKTLDQAIDELRRGSGSQFDPRVVKAFLAMIERDGVHFDA